MMKLKLALFIGLIAPVVSFGQSYCVGGGTATNATQITNVTLAGINNNSASTCSVGYTDYTNITGTVSKGGTYSYSVSTNQACATNANSRLAIYADWGNDGSFNTLGDTILFSTSSSATTTVKTGSFIVPVSAVTGKIRLRVVVRSNNGSPDACASANNLEMEDYSIQVVCNGIGSPVTTRQFDDCSIAAEVFSVSGVGSGYTPTWQLSTNMSTWTDVTNATSYNSPAVNQTTYYRLKVSNGSCTEILPALYRKIYINTTATPDTVCPKGNSQLQASGYPLNGSFTNTTDYAIPDQSSITSTINVSGIIPSNINNVILNKVCVNISHNATEDIDISLIAPNGSSLVLSNDKTGTGYTNTCFVNGATTTVTNGGTHTGNFKPDGGDLGAAFSSSTTNGIWKLVVGDDLNSVTGTLNDWTITFTSPAIQWSPATNLNNAAIANPVASNLLNTITYTATVTYPGNTVCQLTRSQEVAVRDIKLPAVSGTTTVCTGTGTTLTATSTQTGATFSWFSAASGGTAIATGSTYNTGNLTATTTYYCESFFNGCASGTRTAVTVTVVPLPAVPTGSDMEVCYNQNPSVVATCSTAGSSIVWFDAATGGNQLATGSPYNPGPLTTTTTYYAGSTVSPGCASPSRKAIKVTVNPLPAQPTVTNQSVCSGTEATFTATAPGGNYKWYNNLTDPAVANGATFKVTPVNSTQADETKLYYVTTSDAKGCTSSPRTEVQVVVKPIPAGPTITTPTYICQGTSTTLNATALNGADILEWFSAASGGTSLTTGTSYTTPNLSANTSYWIEVNRNGCLNPVRSQQDVNVIFPPVVTDPADKIICSGTPVNQSLSVAPSTAVTLNWTSVADPGLSFSSGNGSGTGNGTSAVINDVIVNTTASANILYTVTSSTTQNGTTCAGNSIDFKVTVHPLPAQPSIADKAICNGDNVSLVATAPGGTYNWYTSNTTPTVLFTGDTYTPAPSPSNTTTYYVTSTDANNCVSSPRKPVVLTVNQIPAAPTVANATICADNTATLAVTSSGDQFDWFDAGGNPVFSGQTYVTPAISSSTTFLVSTTTNGCTGPKKTVSVTTVAAATLDVLTDQIVCSNSGINKTLVGSHPSGVKYTWTSSVTSGVVSGNTSQSTPAAVTTLSNNYVNTGTTVATIDYQVRAISNAAPGCPSSPQNFVISVNPEFNVTVQQTDVICFGQSTGRLVADGSAAKQPATYLWKKGTSTVGTNADLTNINAGTYNLTVFDADNCQVFRTNTIVQPAQDIAITNAVTNVDCNGNASGAIDISVANAVGTTSYSWSNSATTQDLINIPAGSYSVTVTDANLCTKSATITVTQPAAPLSYTSSQTNVLCFGGNNGATSITVTGGTPISTNTPYTYSWNTGQSSKNLSNLVAGTYLETVTDKNGCKLIDIPFNIGEPVALSISKTITNIDCYGTSTGSIDISTVGGTGPYRFKWNSGPVTEDLNNVPVGNYSLLITDANGCKLTDASTISQVSQISGIISPKNISCNGLSDGELDLSVGGGYPPYTFLWNNSQTTEDLTGMPAGTYSVSITDAKNCTVNSSVTLTEPTALSGSLTVRTYIGGLEISCNGSSDGEINLIPAGGTAPYTTTLDGVVVNYPVSGLSAGDYVPGFTDANGCVYQLQKTLNEPVVMASNEVVSTFAGNFNVKCNGSNDGFIQLAPTGGTAPYTYLWTNSATTDLISNLSAGNYDVEITDKNGCKLSDSFVLKQPTAIDLLIDPVVYNGGVNIKCFNGTTGAINTQVSGGTAPYTYLWNTTATSPNLSGLNAGNYSVEVTDANGCKQTGSKVLTQPNQLAGGHITSSFNGYEIRCNGNNNGFIQYNVSGGTAPYQYLWNTAATTASINNLTAGSYQIQVTDNNGCQINANITLNEPPALTSTSTSSDFNGFGVSCAGSTNGSIAVNTQGGTGNKTINWTPALPASFNQNNLSKGVYTYTITDINNCTLTKNVTLTEPAPIGVSANQSTPILCFGDLTGAFSSLVSGGTGTYTYQWFNASPTQVSTNANPSGLPAGTYSLEVTDGNNCKITKAGLTLVEPTKLTASISSSDPTCFGFSDGSALVTATGGTPGYTYQWTAGPSANTWTGIPAGKKTVTITDANNCKTTIDKTLGEPAKLVINTIASALVSCDGKAMGSVQTQAQGGTSPYTFNWSNNSTTPAIGSLTPGTYTLTLKDKMNCTTVASYTVNQVATPDPSFTFVDPICGDLTSTLTVSQSTGFDKMKVLIGNATVTSSNNINYTVSSVNYGDLVIRQEMNEQGCKSSFTDTIPFKDIPEAKFIYDTGKEINVIDNEVEFMNTSIVSSLTPIKYTWSLDQVEVSKLKSPLIKLPNGGSGEYALCLQVVNGYGCSDQYCEPIVVKSKSLVYVPNSFTPDDDGFNDEFAVQSQGIVINDFSFIIMNRSGIEIFKTTDPNFKWDGKHNGQVLNQGVYAFIMKYRSSDHPEYFTKTGSINIVR